MQNIAPFHEPEERGPPTPKGFSIVWGFYIFTLLKNNEENEIYIVAKVSSSVDNLIHPDDPPPPMTVVLDWILPDMDMDDIVGKMAQYFYSMNWKPAHPNDFWVETIESPSEAELVDLILVG
jgi:hypothetical protein